MPAVDPLAADAFVARAEEAVARARRFGRPVLASVTVPLLGDIDVAACTFASRRADERWFVWEQPDRGGFAIGALGAAVTVDAAPAHDRFAQAARSCSDAVRDAVRDDELDRPATGPLWVGGFSFFPDGCSSSAWSSFPPTALAMPELSLARSDGIAHATLNVMCRAGDDSREVAARAAGRLAGLSTAGAAAGRPGSRRGLRDFERPVPDRLRARGGGGSAARALRRRREARAGA